MNNREIIFRGKNRTDGQWLVWELGETTPDVEPETVQQFTGLYDAQGNRIFEGDVVKAETESNNEIFAEEYTIIYDCYGFVAEKLNGDIMPLGDLDGAVTLEVAYNIADVSKESLLKRISNFLDGCILEDGDWEFAEAYGIIKETQGFLEDEKVYEVKQDADGSYRCGACRNAFPDFEKSYYHLKQRFCQFCGCKIHYAGKIYKERERER